MVALRHWLENAGLKMKDQKALSGICRTIKYRIRTLLRVVIKTICYLLAPVATLVVALSLSTHAYQLHCSLSGSSVFRFNILRSCILH